MDLSSKVQSWTFRFAEISQSSPLVAYGMLRVQLFDIDLRIKRTIRRSTIAAAFVAAFFIVSEFASILFSQQLGDSDLQDHSFLNQRVLRHDL